MNMVRAGVVSHPSEWGLSGYREIQSPPDRYRVIDQQALLEALDIRSWEELRRSHRLWVEEALRSDRGGRDDVWTTALAVGSRRYVEEVHKMLGIGARLRQVEQVGEMACVRNAPGAYRAYFEG